jgi:predicted nucleotidyltransferase
MTISEYIDFVLNKLISFYEPQKIYLFGSQARNEANKDSDIDFLVITNSNKPKRLRALDFRKELRGHNYFPVDILVYTPQEFRNESKFKGTIANRVKEEGKILYEQRNTFAS